MNHEHHHHGDHSPHQPQEAGKIRMKQTSVKETEHLHARHETGESETIHDKHAGHHTGDFLKRFWICLVLTIPVLALSHMVQQWLGFELTFFGDKYVLLALGSVIYFYGGWPFLVGMVREIKYKAIGMMTLVAIAISVAFIYSVAVVIGLPGMDFFLGTGNID